MYSASAGKLHRFFASPRMTDENELAEGFETYEL